jgi:[protein-PII] uridylyltransferase
MALAPALSLFDPAPPGGGRLLRAELTASREAALARFAAHGSPGILVRELARCVDRILARCWKLYAVPANATLVAVGGYGRGELFPYSDVDLLILLPESPNQRTAATIETLIGALWDLGIELGHSVRTVEQCVAEAGRDITVQTSLLEARDIAGDRALFVRLATEMQAHLDARQFLRSKVLELQQRHAKFQDTPYALEPNCKESPGGLRDLQIILWIARAAELGGTWSELAQRGLLTAVEAGQLRSKEAWLKRLRVELHLLSRRREDRLLFDVQTALAARFGYAATATRLPSEVLMQRYYLAAKTVIQLNDIFLQNIEAILFPVERGAAVPINERFQALGTLLDIRSDDVFRVHPPALLEAFLLMQQHSELKGMSARTLREIWHGRTLIDGRFRRDPVNRATFIAMLQQPRGIVHEFRRMNQLSVLGRYLPVFRRIVGQMQHDLYHVYTVDQHILMVVRNLRRFAMVEFAHEYPMCSRLIANFARPWLLYIAALFHDIAKGRGGDHSLLGTVDARHFCRDHGLDKEDSALVEFLVEHHLRMSRTAQKEDLSDPAVVAGFAALVGNERHLTALYLLTIADIRGTSPRVWNAWKGKLLDDLFFRTQRALGGGRLTTDAELGYRQAEARRILALYDFDEAAINRFWEQLGVSWMLRQDAQDLAWITRSFAEGKDSEQPRVRARLSPLGEGYQVAVYTPDQPDLLARICEYFDKNRFSILDARIHTTKRSKGSNYALDTFHVSDSGHAHHPDPVAEMRRGLTQHLSHSAPLSNPLQGRLSRQSMNFPIQPTVDLRPDERGQYFLLTLSAADRRGLLYSILRILARHHINVQTAKINTLGDRVEDFFLVEGATLAGPRAQIQLETELLEALAV